MSNPKLRASGKAFRNAKENLEDGAELGAEGIEEDVEERLARLRNDTAALAEDMPDLPDEMRNALNDLEDRIAELYDVVAEQAAYSVETMEEIIEERPWASVAVAFGAGCLLTLLLLPRRAARSWRS
jgi:ElaB/YqjD/DUF883 family membrane-anchored ribosome-binding protein